MVTKASVLRFFVSDERAILTVGMATRYLGALRSHVAPIATK